MRLAILVPDPDYQEPWRWTYDVEADALTRAGATVEPVPWNDCGDLDRFDLILPLVAWGYHLDYERWLGFLARAEAARWPMINPPALLRWNSDKEYLTEADLPLEFHFAQLEPAAARRTSYFEEATSAFERNFIVRALEKCGWNVTATADYLGVPLSTLKYKMDKLEVRQLARRLRGA